MSRTMLIVVRALEKRITEVKMRDIIVLRVDIRVLPV